MAKKAVIWNVNKPFDLDGVHYKPGDEWVQPPTWERITVQDPLNGDRDGFSCERQAGIDQKTKKPLMQAYTAFLPVSERDA